MPGADYFGRAAVQHKAKAEPALKTAAKAEEAATDIDSEILTAATALGYDAAKVRKWVNQRFEVSGGLALVKLSLAFR